MNDWIIFVNGRKENFIIKANSLDDAKKIFIHLNPEYKNNIWRVSNLKLYVNELRTFIKLCDKCKSDKIIRYPTNDKSNIVCKCKNCDFVLEIK